MSQRSNRDQRQFGQPRSPARFDRSQAISRSRSRHEQSLNQTGKISQRSRQRQIVGDSPTKYDIDLYQRKVNRLQAQVSALQDQLSLARFKLKKSEDVDIKNQRLFKLNQDLTIEVELKNQQNIRRQRQIQELRDMLNQARIQFKNQHKRLVAEQQENEDLRKIKQQVKNKVSSDGAQEVASVQESYIRQINNFKKQAKDRQDALKDALNAARSQIQIKDNIEASLKYKLQKIREDTEAEMNRLKQLLDQLRRQLMNQRQNSDQKLTNHRAQLVSQTQGRIAHVRNLTSTIEEALMSEIRNLNEAIRKKDDELAFILAADKRFMDQNQETQSGLREHIRRLEDKIFVLQRQNEIQLFKAIDRLKRQYDQNINSLHSDHDQVRAAHKNKVDALETQIAALKKENNLLGKQNKNVQEEYKKLANQKEIAIKTFSQKIIDLESAKDVDLKNYTHSMKVIQEDAKTKLDNLHQAIQNKNNEFEILNAQLSLKNQEISDLIDQLNKLRETNREKIRKLETTNAMQQNSLNDIISSCKKEILELKRRIHELENQLDDREAQNQLKVNLMREELALQKQINETLKARNDFLYNWCKQLENDIKKERVSNVDILHDHSITRRQTIQIRQQVAGELRSIKDKEVEQIARVFQLEKGRLENDLLKKEHDLRDKKNELQRLLVQYKKLEAKVGKTSKLDKGSQENGKCRATLDAEILLTENIFNAINRP